MTQLRDNERCYVCGKKNPVGLAVDFEIDREARAIKAKFTPSGNHEGYEGIVHGGVLSALLDEAMAKLAYSLGIPAVTAEITVKFKASAAPGDELLVPDAGGIPVRLRLVAALRDSLEKLNAKFGSISSYGMPQISAVNSR